mgnify:CR=1 FL=1
MGHSLAWGVVIGIRAVARGKESDWARVRLLVGECAVFEHQLADVCLRHSNRAHRGSKSRVLY